MGFKISAILGLVIIAMAGGFKLYYDKSEAEKEAMAVALQTAINNQQVLEDTIAKQNADLENQLKRQKQQQEQISQLQTANNQANEAVTELKAKFARHDLNMLSMAKPGLVEKMVNRGTARVGAALKEMTDPEQFDEKPADTDDSAS